MSEIRIETRIDHERGCGWRKAGGKYLVGGELCRPCGKLPFKLQRCRCCDRGIKPARGWTWIGPRHLFKPGHCDAAYVGPADFCELCVLADPPERAGLLWIGGKFYATPEAFAREAARLGISRRIAQIPKDFRVGETLVLLAHREVEFAWGQEPQPGIFAAFVPRAIEYVLRGDESAAELERLSKQGCTLVRVVRVTQKGGASHPDICDTLEGKGDDCAGACTESSVEPPPLRAANAGCPSDGPGDGGEPSPTLRQMSAGLGPRTPGPRGAAPAAGGGLPV